MWFGLRNCVTLVCIAAGAPVGTANAAWKETVLYAFDGTHGASPFGGVIFDPAGNLYGTTSSGGKVGYGTVYQLTPPADGHRHWKASVLTRFKKTLDRRPDGGLLIDAAGDLYGTSAFGGNAGDGTAFELMPPAQGKSKWRVQPLASFNGRNGMYPDGSLVADSSGNLYGATDYGGRSGRCGVDGYGCGTVFQLSPPAPGTTHWTRKNLVHFGGNDGYGPFGSPLLDNADDVFGTTEAGGKFNDGTVYELSPPAQGQSKWSRKVLHEFNGKDGSTPWGNGSLIFDAAGDLYGTTLDGGKHGEGVVFMLTPPPPGKTKWPEKVIHSFNGTDGANPDASVVFDANGNLYGTTYNGSNAGNGVVFELTPPANGKTEWPERVLHGFADADGAHPYAGLTLDSAGNLYGTTLSGGSGDGVVFELSP